MNHCGLFCDFKLNAMDVKSYEQIIEARGKDATRKGLVTRRPVAEQKLRGDLLAGKVVWTDNRNKDFVSYLRVNHSLISIFSAPSAHPYSKMSRFILTLSQTCIALFFSAFATVFLEDSGTVVDISYSIYCSICTTIATKFTTCCLVCQCIDNFPPICRKCVHCCGMQFVGGMVCYSIFLLLVGILLISLSDNDTTSNFLLIFILSTIESYLIEILVGRILFELSWRKEHELAKEGKLKKETKYYITFEEYNQFKQSGNATATEDDNNDNDAESGRTIDKDQQKNQTKNIKPAEEV